eukprot:Platyproteum_vivax@DN6211_c0_g2_i1.p1
MTRWADVHDDDEDEDYDTGKTSWRPGDKPGEIKFIMYYKKPDNKNYRLVKVYHRTTRTERTCPALEERKKWAKFGETKQNHQHVVKSDRTDLVYFESPKKPVAIHDDKIFEEDWSHLLKPKSGAWKPSAMMGVPKEEEKPSQPAPEAPRRAVYQAPSMKNPENKEDCTLRVTNLSEDVREEDLKELFGKVGRVLRVYLAKHKDDMKRSKGFAFVTYQ